MVRDSGAIWLGPPGAAQLRRPGARPRRGAAQGARRRARHRRAHRPARARGRACRTWSPATTSRSPCTTASAGGSPTSTTRPRTSQAALEQADASASPSARLSRVDAAYWTDVATKEHLRWVLPEPEAAALDALARLHAAGRDQLVPDSRLVGMFRAHGLLVPVWDLEVGTGAAALEEPAAAFRAALDEALGEHRIRCRPRSVRPAAASQTGRSRSVKRTIPITTSGIRNRNAFARCCATVNHAVGLWIRPVVVASPVSNDRVLPCRKPGSTRSRRASRRAARARPGTTCSAGRRGPSRARSRRS